MNKDIIRIQKTEKIHYLYSYMSPLLNTG